MGAACLVAVGCALFASAAGLALAAGGRGAPAPVRRLSPRGLRLASRAGLAATFLVLGAALGWELAVPVWLALLSVAATASLFLAAVSARWHAAATLLAACAALAGGGAALLASLPLPMPMSGPA